MGLLWETHDTVKSLLGCYEQLFKYTDTVPTSVLCRPRWRSAPHMKQYIIFFMTLLGQVIENIMKWWEIKKNPKTPSIARALEASSKHSTHTTISNRHRHKEFQEKSTRTCIQPSHITNEKYFHPSQQTPTIPSKKTTQPKQRAMLQHKQAQSADNSTFTSHSALNKGLHSHN